MFALCAGTVEMLFFLLVSINYQFFHNTPYLLQFHTAGVKKESVPGDNCFSKIEKFMSEHCKEGENYREFLKCT